MSCARIESGVPGFSLAPAQSLPDSVVVDQPISRTIGQFMTSQPCVVDAALTLNDAQERMALNNIRHLVVERHGRLAGVLSMGDVAVARSLAGTRGEALSVTDAMLTTVFTCSPSDDLAAIALEMEMHRFDCVIVVENEFVTGIFTATDALRALREVLVGHPVERGITPQHLPSREHVDLVNRHVSLSDMLKQHGGAPRADDGMLFSH